MSDNSLSEVRLPRESNTRIIFGSFIPLSSNDLQRLAIKLETSEIVVTCLIMNLEGSHPNLVTKVESIAPSESR